MDPNTDRKTVPAATLDSPLGTRVVLYLAFAAAVFMPYGLNLLVLAAAWALAMTLKPRDIPLTILLTVLSLAASVMWAFLPA